MDGFSNISKTTVAVGIAGAFFLGYCIYFDQKRRGAKDFKKKLHDKRLERENRKVKKGKSKIPDVSIYNEFVQSIKINICTPFLAGRS